MKKLSFLLVFAAMVFFACNDSDSVNTEKKEVNQETVVEDVENEEVNQEVAEETAEAEASEEVRESAVKLGTGIAYVKEGKLYFYYPESAETKPLEAETDSVFNCVFNKDEDIIYYTVIRNGVLWLREAKFQADNEVIIKDLCDLKIKKEDCISETYGEKAMMMINKNNDVILKHAFMWNCYGFSKMLVYSPQKGGQTAKYKIYDYKIESDFFNFSDFLECEFKDNNLIYDGNNLTKDLNLKPDEEQTEVEFLYFKFSKDKSKLMFGALLGFGDLAHGAFCIANIDGTHQQKLNDDGLSSEFRPYWYDNQAVFVREIEGEADDYTTQFCITNADDNGISVIAENIDFYAVREF